ncbi:MAG: protein-disulfide reductase DsbD domain-containing protein, partial [Pseudomonadota bacterium]
MAWQKDATMLHRRARDHAIEPSWPIGDAELRAGAMLLALLFAALAIMAGPLTAQAQQTPRKPLVEASLIAEKRGIVPGQSFTVALRQKITPKWHTYWRYAGDSGEATRLNWTLPAGFKASAIRWPTPEAIPVSTLMNYGYSDEVLLLVTITPPAEFRALSAELKVDANWLVCEPRK